MSSRIDTALTLSALHMAIIQRQPDAGLRHHCDRGSQYAAHDYRAVLEKHGRVAAMSGQEDGWDNAVAESFFATLKGACVGRDKFRSRIEAKAIVFDYVEVLYNRQRARSYMRYDMPSGYEQHDIEHHLVA